jgi:hypothetical protein
MQKYGLPMVTVAGTPAEMGRSYGERLRDMIRQYVPHRLNAAKEYLDARGFDGRADLRGAGELCLNALRDWDESGFDEFVATAEAAGVDAYDLYAAANYSDIRDLVLLRDDATVGAEEGCTSVAIPRSKTKDDRVIAAQTWDLHPRDIEYVVAVQRRPASGAATWSVTTVGTPTLIGINELGLYVGTTNLKMRGVRAGVPYLSLLHGAIGCESHGEAAVLVEKAPRVAAHSYWFADEHGAVELECSATTCIRREMASEPLIQTNHCLDADHQERESEPPSHSSLHRLRRTQALMQRSPHDVSTIQLMFQDRMDGVNSINRYPEDEQIAATNACAIGVPAERALYACRGPADQGVWERLAFEAA